MRLNRRIILGLLSGVLLIAIFTAVLMPSSVNIGSLDFYIEDSNHNFHYEAGEELRFLINDSSLMEKPMVWHFGNGDTSMQRKNVRYTYDSVGKYMVTLELENGRYKTSHYVDIISIPKKVALDSVAAIYGEEVGYVGEELVFSSYGPGVTSWFWEFGETGTVDAYEGQVVYVYRDPGTYQVKLKTNISTYPVYHKIQILSLFEEIDESDPIDSMMIARSDLKQKFQAIADAKVSNKRGFYDNLKYIERNYTCQNAAEIVVVINDEKYNDLYSYCQGLHALEGRGERTLVIDDVNVDAYLCIKRIEVKQRVVEK